MIHDIHDNLLVDIPYQVVKQQGTWTVPRGKGYVGLLAFFPTVIFPFLDKIPVFCLFVCLSLYFKGTVTTMFLGKEGPACYPMIYCSE